MDLDLQLTQIRRATARRQTRVNCVECRQEVETEENQFRKHIQQIHAELLKDWSGDQKELTFIRGLLRKSLEADLR
jgi:hypothetical protein